MHAHGHSTVCTRTFWSSVFWQPYVPKICTAKLVVGCYVFSVGNAAWLFTLSKFSNAILLCLLPRLLHCVLFFLTSEADCNGKPGQKSSQVCKLMQTSGSQTFVLVLLIALGSGTPAAYRRVDEAGLSSKIEPPGVPVAVACTCGQLQNLLPC